MKLFSKCEYKSIWRQSRLLFKDRGDKPTTQRSNNQKHLNSQTIFEVYARNMN